MGLKDDIARLQSELNYANRKIDALQKKLKAIYDRPKSTGDYPLRDSLSRFDTFYASQAEVISTTAHQRILASEGQEDLT